MLGPEGAGAEAAGTETAGTETAGAKAQGPKRQTPNEMASARGGGCLPRHRHPVLGHRKATETKARP